MSTYNGYTNYATWAVSLWIDNDEGSQSYWAERAQDCYNDAEADQYHTRKEDATTVLAQAIQNEHEEQASELVKGNNVFSDLLTHALDEVNWYEIAELMLEDVDEDTDDEFAADTLANMDARSA